MTFNSGGGFNVSPFNVIISSESYSGLQFLQCTSWADGPSHGGVISETVVTTVFDYINDAENQAGATDYRKGFIKNFGTVSTGVCNTRPSLVIPNALVDRLSVKIALGTPTDDMTNKPLDAAFSSVLTTEIEPGASIPVWLKRTILAGGAEPGSYLGIQLILTVSES